MQPQPATALQYRRSTTGGGAKPAAVDWELFEETLARVDPCFSDPRFDSLKHVLTVLSSSNAEQEVAEVRAAGAGRLRRPGQAVAGGMAALNACSNMPPMPPAWPIPPAHWFAIWPVHAAALSLPLTTLPQLREQRAAIEEMVDAVVEGYHAGFNKSIHNYSLILRLFTESRLQVGRARMHCGAR